MNYWEAIRRIMLWRGLWTWPPWVICAPAIKLQVQEILHFPGVSEIVFVTKPHKLMEELRIGQRKGYPMDHCGTETLQPASQFKMADRLARLPLDVAQHCSVSVLPLQKFLCEIVLRNKALVYLLNNKHRLNLAVLKKGKIQFTAALSIITCFYTCN